MNANDAFLKRLLGRETIILATLVFIVSFLSGFLMNCSSLSRSTRSQYSQGTLFGNTVHRYVLDNGLKLLVIEDDSSPTFAYQTWYRVGARHEVPNYTGLAHLFEHMMFKRTKNFGDGESEKLLEKAGVEGFNAFTSKDYTAYIQELPSSQLELIARIESDRMRNLIVDDSAFATEREVVQNERRFRNENDPKGMMYQMVYEVAFQNHSYRWPVIGYEADLMRMSAQDARNFYNTYYSPERATVVIVGDVKKEKVLNLVLERYGAIPRNGSADPVYVAEKTQTAPKIQTARFNLSTELILMGYKVPPLMHEDAPAVLLLQNLLAEGKSSLLSNALVGTGQMSSIITYSSNAPFPSLAIFMGTMQKGKKAISAESQIQIEIDRLQSRGISEEAVAKARNLLLLELFQSFSSANDRANFLGQFETNTTHFQNGVNLYQRIKEVTSSDLKRVARLYFGAKSRTTILGVSK